jgi:hypothetical protein
VVWNVLDRPPDYDPCSEATPAEQDDALRAFRYPALAIALPIWALGVYWMLTWSREARVRRGQPGRPGIPALVAALLAGLEAVGLAIDTFNVSGPDVGGLGLVIILVSIVFVVPLALVALALLAVGVSLFAREDRWRNWLDRTGPFALGTLVLIGIPFLYAFVLERGGDATFC